MKIHIETERLILRDWKDSDVEVFARMNADPLIMEYFPKKLDDQATQKLIDVFKAHLKQYGYGFYAVECKGNQEFIGFAGIAHVKKDMPFAPAVELAWRFDYGHWGKGYATEAALAVLHDGFSNHQLNEIIAYCIHDNARAMHVMDKVVMSRDKDGDFEYPVTAKPSLREQYVLYRLVVQDFQTP